MWTGDGHIAHRLDDAVGRWRCKYEAVCPKADDPTYQGDWFLNVTKDPLDISLGR